MGWLRAPLLVIAAFAISVALVPAAFADDPPEPTTTVVATDPTPVRPRPLRSRSPSRHLNRLRRGRLRRPRRRFSRVPPPIAGAGSRPRDQACRQEGSGAETREAEEEGETQGCRQAEPAPFPRSRCRADSRCGRLAAAHARASRRLDQHDLSADPACAVLRDRMSDHRSRSRAPVPWRPAAIFVSDRQFDLTVIGFSLLLLAALGMILNGGA